VNRSVVSGGSSVSKPVPKLARSRRDTSPVYGERLSQTPSLDDSASHSTPAQRRRSPRLNRGIVPMEAMDEPSVELSRREAANSPPQATTERQPDSEPLSPLVVLEQRAANLSARAAIEKAPEPTSPGVRARLQEWETRIEKSHSQDAEEKIVEHQRSPNNEQGISSGVAAWKSFLGKKVSAESEAAAAAGASRSPPSAKDTSIDSKEPEGHYKKKVYTTETDFSKPTGVPDEDSLYQFKNRSSKSGRPKGHPDDLNISDLSPIQVSKDSPSDTDTDTDEAESEAYGPPPDQRTPASIFKRLSECAAPYVPARMSPTSGGAAKYLPPAMCGRPDADEPESIASSAASGSSTERHTRSASFGDDKPRSKPSPPRRDRETIPVSSSSVVSEDFGAKTAYLEAVAMRTAVSKPKRSSSARRDRTSGSSVVSSSTVHSERWKDFLERKKATGATSKTSNSDVSRAAEKYASNKVDEIMSKMASRSKSVARSRDVHKEYDIVDPIADGDDERAPSKSTSVQAAEDLAAARVEAMMAALSSGQNEEGEI